MSTSIIHKYVSQYILIVIGLSILGDVSLPMSLMMIDDAAGGGGGCGGGRLVGVYQLLLHQLPNRWIASVHAICAV